MTVNPYATQGDLATFLSTDPPATAPQLLTHAQEVVDAIMTGSQYSADDNGNPTDATVLTALKNAVCAQVGYWIATGDEDETLSQFTAYSIEGISVNRGASSGTSGGRHYRICDRAWDFLRAAKLVPGTVSST